MLGALVSCLITTIRFVCPPNAKYCRLTLTELRTLRIVICISQDDTEQNKMIYATKERAQEVADMLNARPVWEGRYGEARPILTEHGWSVSERFPHAWKQG
jgi:hypothetical protein